MDSRLLAYIKLLFQPFFRWWWAVITGFASIFGVLVTPQTGFVLKSPSVAMISFTGFSMAFLTLSALVQGWGLYRKRYTDLIVATIQKTKEYGGDYVTSLRGEVDLPIGTLVELRRPVGDDEILFAVVEIRNRTARGNYVRVPIWTSAGHQKDYFGGRFTPSELVVIPHVQRETLDRLQAAP